MTIKYEYDISNMKLSLSAPSLKLITNIFDIASYNITDLKIYCNARNDDDRRFTLDDQKLFISKIPLTVKKLTIANFNWIGSYTDLPGYIEELHLIHTSYKSGILNNLPSSLKILNYELVYGIGYPFENDLTQLPYGLEKLIICNGVTCDLTHLPSSLKHLSISMDLNFYGNISILPDNLEILEFTEVTAGCNINKVVNTITNIPSSLQKIIINTYTTPIYYIEYTNTIKKILEKYNKNDVQIINNKVYN